MAPTMTLCLRPLSVGPAVAPPPTGSHNFLRAAGTANPRAVQEGRCVCPGLKFVKEFVWMRVDNHPPPLFWLTSN